MRKNVSTRLEEDEIKKLIDVAEAEHIDRSGLIRKFVLDQLKQYDIKRVGEYYRKGVMSLQEAATAANVSIYDMMEYVQKEGIRPPVQSVAEIDAEIHDAIEISKSVVKTTKKDAR